MPRPALAPGSARPAPWRALRFRRAGRCPSDGSAPVPAKGLTPTPPASYARIRSRPLTYRLVPGGWFAGTDTRTARRGGRLSADKGSTADILAWAGRMGWRSRGASGPARGAAYPRIRAILLTYWRGPGGRFAGTEARTARHGGRTLSVDKVSTADILVQPGGWFAGTEARTARHGGGLSADKGNTADILVQPGGLFAGAEA